MDAKEFIKRKILEGETQQQIADKCKFSQATVYKIVNTNTDTSIATLRKIAKAYNTPLSAFIDGVGQIVYDPQNDIDAAKYAEPPKPPTISEQIGPGYSSDVKLIADYLEVKIEGKTREERLAIIEEIMAEIRNKYK